MWISDYNYFSWFNNFYEWIQVTRYKLNLLVNEILLHFNLYFSKLNQIEIVVCNNIMGNRFRKEIRLRFEINSVVSHFDSTYFTKYISSSSTCFKKLFCTFRTQEIQFDLWFVLILQDEFKLRIFWVWTQ